MKINEFYSQVPQKLKEKLVSQEKSLIKSKESQSKQIKVAEYVAKKTKQTIEDLMMNNIDSFRMKMEVKSLLEQRQENYLKHGISFW